jgi:predicted GIY-YIG superfamily endonuclease
MWYVYIIRSINFPDQEYTGATDLKRRIPDHNAGKSTHTANSSLGNLSGIAPSRTNTERWNSRNISNLIPAGHLRRSASDA